MTTYLGLIGLGTMGANLARNAARNGATVAVFNRTTEKTDKFMSDFAAEGSFIGCASIDELISALPTPRAIVLMVKAGQAVDDMIAELAPRLDDGDILIDAGNSHYNDTERRIKELAAKKIRFIGMGVSGGEEGALKGPSMMPGGDASAIDELMPLFKKMAADDGLGGKCVANMGEGGAGHFVKMVHNGIEYGIMQLIAESYDVLKRGNGRSNAELAEIFSSWNKSPELSSFLLEITAKIFTKKDDQSDADLIDVILDAAGQKGTGKWTTNAALDLGQAIPTIDAAVAARILSGDPKRSKRQINHFPIELPKAQKITIDDVAATLECSMLCTYNQGFHLMERASSEYGWELSLDEIARIWLGGCIIRSEMLNMFMRACSTDASVASHAVEKEITERLGGGRQEAWRKTVCFAHATGVPIPATGATLSYFDTIRSEHLPQNLIQAQRDFFGAHTFARTDKEGSFHATWE